MLSGNKNLSNKIILQGVEIVSQTLVINRFNQISIKYEKGPKV